MKQSGLARSKLVLLALIWIAFALRVYRLEVQSLWSDEGLSLYRSRLTIAQNLSNIIVVPPNVPTQDTNPPLYFILLGGLRAVAGESEYALRFLSVIAGVLLVPLIYVTARRLFSPQAALCAAVLAALSPFMVWYSQEARMYTLLAALSLASVYLCLRAIERPADTSSRRSRSYWLAWIVVTLAALYTHFTAFFLVAFEGIVMVWVVGRSRRRAALIVGAGLVVLSIPIVWYAWSRAQNGIDPGFGFRPLGSIAEELCGTFLIGRTNSFFQPWWAVAPGLVVLIMGMIAGLVRSTQRASMFLTLLYLLVPLLMFYAVTFVRPLYTGPRHLMLITPPFYLIVAVGLAWLWQRLRLVGLAAFAWTTIMMIVWLRVQFFDPAYLKDDMRSAAHQISDKVSAGDVVVVEDAISSFVFGYYYTGSAPWVIIPNYPSLNVDAAINDLQARANSADRVWLVTEPAPLSGFPKNALDEWARGHLLRLGHEKFASLWLGSAYQLYTAHFPIYDSLPNDASPRAIPWLTDTLRLSGTAPIVVSADRNMITTTLYWELEAQPNDNLIFTRRLIDDTGAEWGLEINPAFDNWSAKQWPIGKLIKQVSQIDLPHGLPSGHYRLMVSVAEKSGLQFTLPDGTIETEVNQITVSP